MSLFAATPAVGYLSYAYLPAAAVLYDASGGMICSLPATYFTVIEGDASGGKYPVSYLDLYGYVYADKVEVVDYEPVTKFAALSARPYNDGMAVNLRDKPSRTDGKVLCSVPASATLTLYGPREGDELFAGAGTAWQYVRYDQPGGPIYGYAYSPQLSCDAVQPNKIEKVERPDNSPEVTDGSISLGKNASIAVAAAMCVPAGIIMLVLFYRPDSKRTPRHSPQKR